MELLVSTPTPKLRLILGAVKGATHMRAFGATGYNPDAQTTLDVSWTAPIFLRGIKDDFTIKALIFSPTTAIREIHDRYLRENTIWRRVMYRYAGLTGDEPTLEQAVRIYCDWMRAIFNCTADLINPSSFGIEDSFDEDAYATLLKHVPATLADRLSDIAHDLELFNDDDNDLVPQELS